MFTFCVGGWISPDVSGFFMSICYDILVVLFRACIVMVHASLHKNDFRRRVVQPFFINSLIIFLLWKS